MDSSKTLAPLIIAKISPKPGMGKDDSESMDSTDSDVGLDTASDEIMQAIADKDSGALKKALKAFVEQCDSYDDKAEEK